MCLQAFFGARPMEHVCKSQNFAERGDRNPEGLSLSIAGINATTIFLPDRALTELAQLSEDVWRRRQRRFLMSALRLENATPDIVRKTRFDFATKQFKAMSQSLRQQLCEHPEFRAWLLQIDRVDFSSILQLNNSKASIYATLEEFSNILSNFLQSHVNMDHQQEIYLRRFDVEKSIAEIAPPSYIFSDCSERKEKDASNPYTLFFFNQVLEAVLRRIGYVWPGMVQMVPRFVRMIIHLPNADFRSCSAQRFAGAIMLTANDDSLLALEESLIHECGHQILYSVMELDPLIKQASSPSFALPWSGSQRDAYGYFHATYIYLVLALYFEAAQDRFADEQLEVRERLLQILVGLKSALPDFENAVFFTPVGERFFSQLREISNDLFSRNTRLMASQ